jgi:hypothetical protein
VKTLDQECLKSDSLLFLEKLAHRVSRPLRQFVLLFKVDPELRLIQKSFLCSHDFVHEDPFGDRVALFLTDVQLERRRILILDQEIIVFVQDPSTFDRVTDPRLREDSAHVKGVEVHTRVVGLELEGAALVLVHDDTSMLFDLTADFFGLGYVGNIEH